MTMRGSLILGPDFGALSHCCVAYSKFDMMLFFLKFYILFSHV